jgi:hypothetical protein
MRDILRLLLGDGPTGDGAGIWDGRRGRRPSVASSREWCGTEPDGGAIGRVARTLHGRLGSVPTPVPAPCGRGRGGRAAGRGRGLGPF